MIRQHKALQGRSSKQRYRDRKLEIYNLLGGKCVECNESDERVLQIDHRYSDGNKERTLSRSKLYKKVRNNTRRYQLLCANCNWRKRSKDIIVQSRDNSWWRTKRTIIVGSLIGLFIIGIGVFKYYG